MRFIRFKLDDGPPVYGWLQADQVGRLEGTPFGEYRRLEPDYSLDRVDLLAPVEPGKIICFGVNYADHAREHGIDLPETPLFFTKPPSAVIGHGAQIELPPQSKRVEHEAELALVIGQRGRWIAAEEAHKFIMGYTISNDVTARDLQQRDGQWARSKGFDTFCPIGPWIETDFDPIDAIVTCHVNGELRQMVSTQEMLFSIPQLISYVSSVMTLYPGDIILTGTPAGVGVLNPGDIVKVGIEGIGELSNPVVAVSRD
jgi:2-keto-4-pentenoate hydratase/2-oxohepta-3-ene-1,7-dioic acid hydratase in catechol pathway